MEIAGDGEQDSALERITTFSGKIPDGLYFRAAAGKSVGGRGDKGFSVDDLTITFKWFDDLVVLPRSASGDLLVPIKPEAEKIILRQRLEW